MKKQILSIILMIVAICIAGASLAIKNQDNTSAGHHSDSQIPSLPELTMDSSSGTDASTVVPSKTTGAAAATPRPENESIADLFPTSAPEEGMTDTYSGSSQTPAPNLHTSPRPDDGPKATTTPDTVPSYPTISPAPTTAPTPAPTATAPVTDAYPKETVDTLVSLGVTAEEIDSLADIGVTDDEINSVLSSIHITPALISQLTEYRDMWANASDFERKLLVNLLKQMVGQ